MQDLIAAGIAGLQKAISRFDPDRGFKFSTYSHWWIRQTIQRSVIQQGRIIRCALHSMHLLSSGLAVDVFIFCGCTIRHVQ